MLFLNYEIVLPSSGTVIVFQILLMCFSNGCYAATRYIGVRQVEAKEGLWVAGSIQYIFTVIYAIFWY